MAVPLQRQPHKLERTQAVPPQSDDLFHNKFLTELDGQLAEKKVTLTKEWQTVRIPLSGDASSVKTGFRWVLGGHGRPVTFYLDDVRFE